jgi:hypothetical protein
MFNLVVVASLVVIGSILLYLVLKRKAVKRRYLEANKKICYYCRGTKYIGTARTGAACGEPIQCHFCED